MYRLWRCWKCEDQFCTGIGCIAGDFGADAFGLVRDGMTGRIVIMNSDKGNTP